MARHPWLEKSRNELLEMFAANALTPQSTDSVLIRTIVESRIAEEQLRAAARNAEAGDQLASFTKGLVDATQRLGTATWGLVVATGALVITEVIFKVWLAK